MVKRGRGMSRARRREEQIRAAELVELPAQASVCVVGGGAAGLVAAICAAKREHANGARVVVLESAPACGQKILATGNGRCNFANAHLEPALYNDPAFVDAVAGKTWLNDILGFFVGECGLAWEREGDRYYPLSRQAASVRNVLLARAAAAGVTLAPAREVVGVAREGNNKTHGNAGLRVRFRKRFGNEDERELVAQSVVVATGGGAPSTCEGLGLEATDFRPALCPLACEGPALAALDGRRARARATLLRDGREVATQRGEVLFRSYGLSGIVVFDLSRHARPGDEVALDLLPDLAPKTACARAERTLDGMLDPVIARALELEAQHAVRQPSPLERRRAALALAKDLRYVVVGLAETNRAQVSRGGLATSQFDPQTLGARDVPGLFACGEALDVDGPCGGFNLAWAWKSGMVAGTAAAAMPNGKGEPSPMAKWPKRTSPDGQVRRGEGEHPMAKGESSPMAP